MATFPVSPGVKTVERDLSLVPIPAGATTGAFAGQFNWGPICQPVLVGSLPVFIDQFGKPSNSNPETWYTPYNFLSYGGYMYISRSGNTTSFSNTLSGTWTNTTTFNIPTSVVGANTITGITVGEIVEADQLPFNTLVSGVAVNGTNTVITVSKPYNATVSNTVGQAIFTSATGVFTAICNTGAVTTPMGAFNVGNSLGYDTLSPSFPSQVPYIAKYPGSLGNSLKVSVCDTADAYQSTINLTNYKGDVSTNSTATGISFTIGANVAQVVLANNALSNDILVANLASVIHGLFTPGDWIMAGNASTIGVQNIQITGVSNLVIGNTSGTNTGIVTFNLNLSTNYNMPLPVTMTSITRSWEYYKSVDAPPGQSYYQATYGNTAANDELHLVVVDEDGAFSGVSDNVLYVFQGLSRATDAMSTDNENNYYKTVLNDTSKYLWWASDRAGAPSNTALHLTSSTNLTPLSLSFWGGADGATESQPDFGALGSAWAPFASKDDYDINLIPVGKSTSSQLANYIMSNIVDVREDCVLFASPKKETVVNVPSGTIAANVVSYFNDYEMSSYMVLDSGYKYQFDSYNSMYRWVPLNGDIAGTCVYNDSVGDVWTSPAGMTRGKIKNCVKLAWNPKQADRDTLYTNWINPVITKTGEGTILYGDKTHLGYQTAFSRINVRRLFNYLKKTISNLADHDLFELNTDITRTQFVNQITPLLRDIKARNGIDSFDIICNASNNTDLVIDNNQFVGSILVKPSRSINFILLNFAAVGSAVDFTEASAAI